LGINTGALLDEGFGRFGEKILFRGPEFYRAINLAPLGRLFPCEGGTNDKRLLAYPKTLSSTLGL